MSIFKTLEVGINKYIYYITSEENPIIGLSLAIFGIGALISFVGYFGMFIYNHLNYTMILPPLFLLNAFLIGRKEIRTQNRQT